MDRARSGGTNAARDRRDQAVVLTHVLALHPAHLSVAELVGEMIAGAAEFEPRDRYERAIHDLAAAGLLHVQAGLVTPTRAALVFNSLDMD
ncbi:MAG TPA: hypothetical protein VMS60_07735 [Solirubrobacterales bacterium]|nr:hypothetical protein [Solirubrobacterales bacterium]